MKYNRFEDVPVWRDGIDLAVRVFALTEDRAFRFRGDIANQIQRAALSVSNNIAEGFERGTTSELITFLYIARGSAGEVRSILCVVEKMPVFSPLLPRLPELKALAESVSRQLRAWAESLQNSGIGGQRYLTEKSRESYRQDQRATAFLDRLKKMNEEAAKEREELRKSEQPKDVAGSPPGSRI
jgi:four helix bundle protein